MRIRSSLFALFALVPLSVQAAPPGTVIAHAPAAKKEYIGSPSIAVLKDGGYVVSHDFVELGHVAGGQQRTLVMPAAGCVLAREQAQPEALDEAMV